MRHRVILMVTPKIGLHSHLWNPYRLSFGQRIFAAVIKFRILRWDYPGLLGCSYWDVATGLLKCSCKTQKKRRQGHRGGSYVTTAAEIRGIQLKGMQTNTKSWKSQRTDFLLEPPEVGWGGGLLTPGFWTCRLQNSRRIHFYCFKLPSSRWLDTAATGV